MLEFKVIENLKPNKDLNGILKTLNIRLNQDRLKLSCTPIYK